MSQETLSQENPPEGMKLNPDWLKASFDVVELTLSVWEGKKKWQVWSSGSYTVPPSTGNRFLDYFECTREEAIMNSLNDLKAKKPLPDDKPNRGDLRIIQRLDKDMNPIPQFIPA